MNFNKPKEQVIADAMTKAEDCLYTEFNNIKYGLVNNSQGSNLDMMASAIARAIGTAVRSIVEDTYTDVEFEEDIKLRT